VTDPIVPPVPDSPSPATSSSGGSGGSTGPVPGSLSSRPRSIEGRARTFRESQARRRSARRGQIGQILVVAILVLAVYTIVTARPYSPSSLDRFPSPGPPIVVDFGTPNVSSVACAGGGQAYAERIPWMNSTLPVTTGDLNVRVYEIWDGDIVGDPNVVANATSTNLCAGSPPDSRALWYAVLTAPNGTNLLTYTVDNGWASLTRDAWNVWIQNGSFVTLVTGISLAGTGRGFAVVGSEGGSSINGAVPL